MTTAGLQVYRLASAALSPFLPGYLRSRARAGKEDPARLGERLGRASVARPAGELVWLHGVSVGESLSLLPLAERLRTERPDLAVLTTSGTRTSAELLPARLPAGVIHQYAPLDAPGAVRAFLDHWRPASAIFVESELWPNLILDAKRRGVRLALLSARMTQKSADGWRPANGAARALLNAFDLVLAQDIHTRLRLEALGGRVDGYLNLKDLAAPLGADEAELARLRAEIGGRPVILGASTHPGEDELFTSAVAMMRPLRPRPLLILAPRHPGRGPQIAADLASDSRRVARRGAGEAIGPATDVYVADTLGEMGLFFRLADVAVMGGSFVPGIGGHNPLEPARLGTAVIFGEEAFNFRGLNAEMLVGGLAARQAETEEQLTELLDELIADPAARRRLGEGGRAFAAERGGRFDAAWAQLEPLLPPP